MEQTIPPSIESDNNYRKIEIDFSSFLSRANYIDNNKVKVPVNRRQLKKNSTTILPSIWQCENEEEYLVGYIVSGSITTEFIAHVELIFFPQRPILSSYFFFFLLCMC